MYKIIFAVLLLLIVGCSMPRYENQVPKVPSQEQVILQPSQQEVIDKTSSQNQEVQNKIIIPKETMIKIERKSFLPSELTTKTTEKITFVNIDDRMHLVSCYKGSQRVYTSNKIQPDGKSFFTFVDEGDYLCVDAIYGTRMVITSQKQQNAITGNIVVGNTKNGNILIPIIVITLFLLMFIINIYKKK